MTRRNGRKNRSLRLQRHRHRRQRGGQAPSKSFSDWIDLVKGTQLLEQSDATMGTIKQEALIIPSAKGETAEDVTIPGLYRPEDETRFVDYRMLAAQLAGNDLLYDTVINHNGSSDQFKEGSRKMDPVSLTQLLTYENALRRAADKSPITDLADTTAYPLLIWFLAKNFAGDEEEATPVLVSPEQVKQTIASLSESSATPSAPVE